MLITVTVRSAAGSRDLELSCAGDEPVAVVLAELLKAAGSTARGGLVDGVAAHGDRPVGEVLLHGSTITVGQAASPAPLPGLALHAVGGRQAGMRWHLSPGEHALGRDPAHLVALDHPSVSRTHATILATGSTPTLVDHGSTNGLWARAERVSRHQLDADEPVVVGGTALALPQASDPMLTVVARAGRLEVNLPPRIHPARESQQFAMPSSPAERPRPTVPWLQLAGPLTVGVAMAFLVDPRFLLFTLLAPLMTGGQALAERRRHKRDTASTTEAHLAAVRSLQLAVTAALEDEARGRRRAAPDPATVLDLVTGPTSRLWERRPADSDWLQLRLGLAALPSEVVVDGEASTLPDVPLLLDLAQVKVLGVAGPPTTRHHLAEWLLGQACALHHPGDLSVDVLADEPALWHWTRWLPHRHSPDARAQLLVVDGARRHRTAPGLADLLRDPGSHVLVCLDEQVENLPAECSAIACLTDEPLPRVELRIRGQASVIGLPDLVHSGWAEQLTRSLAPVVDTTPSARGLALPTDTGWTGPTDADALRSAWRQPTTRVELGVTSHGLFEVDLAADGPHMLVAGTTGSGKSEALRTLVTALAAANPPEALAFLLMDFKGGAAFTGCAQLPHVAGLVTDLDPSLTERALTSLTAELRHREQLLRSAGVDDLRDYPGTAAGLEPLARLVIVVDEFATLSEELPDFVGGLVGIAQRGRSLGIHLVLATQRPEGCVSADIRANTSLRLCLAVVRESESRDVVDAPDAALLPPGSPGRGYARVGSGPLRAVQLARVTTAARVAGPSLRVRDAWSRDPDEVEELPTALELLVRASKQLLSRGDVVPPRAPWLPPLPEIVSSADSTWALADLPHLQRQDRLRAAGHLLIVGAPRSGRTSAARAFVRALVAEHSPDDVHVYAVDDSGSWGDLSELPHCGAVVRVHDTDRLVRLVAMLSAAVAARREAGLADAPDLVLVVDRWDSALDALERHDGGRWVDALHALVSDGAAARLQVIAVASGRSPSSRLRSAVDQTLALRMSDPTDLAMYGIPLRSVPAAMPPGRGFLVGPGGTSLVQVALSEHRSPSTAAAERPPRRVDPLPPSIGVAQAEALRRASPTEIGFGAVMGGSVSAPTRNSARSADRPSLRVLLGVGGDELGPIDLDVVEVGPAFVIAGPPRSGRSTALARIVSGLCERKIAVAALLPRPSVVSGVRLLSPGDRLPPDHVLACDDVELAEPWALDLLETALREARDGGPTVLLAGTTEDLVAGFRGPVVEARRSRCGLILTPRSPHDGELLGVRLPQPAQEEQPAGRGVLVRRGELLPIQVVR